MNEAKGVNTDTAKAVSYVVVAEWKVQDLTRLRPEVVNTHFLDPPHK